MKTAGASNGYAYVLTIFLLLDESRLDFFLIDGEMLGTSLIFLLLHKIRPYLKKK